MKSKAVKKKNSRSKSKSGIKAGSKKAVQSKFAQSLRSMIWPQERDFIARPDRYKYVRKIIQPQACVFCEAHKIGPSEESLILKQTEHSILMLNKYPYNNGHLLVLPRQHIGSVLDLSETEYTDVQLLLLEAVRAVKSVYQCPGLNIGMNHGAVAGAGIPDHLHWHLVPRWAGDTNFFPIIAETKVLIETVEESYRKLLAYFERL